MSTKSLFSPGTDAHFKNRALIGSVIVIEGIIGAGKSTLGYSLEKYLQSLNLPAKFYPEFKNKALLDLYISDMTKYAYPFQVIMARERLRIYKEASSYARNGGIAVIDRSLLGDFTFALMQQDQGNISVKEMEVYNNLIFPDSDNFNKENYSLEASDIEPSVTIYLHCEPKIAFDRMISRNISSEVSGYTLGYFNTLQQYYERSLIKFYGDNLITSLKSSGEDHLFVSGGSSGGAVMGGSSGGGRIDSSNFEMGCNNILLLDWIKPQTLPSEHLSDEKCQEILTLIRKKLFG